MSAGGGDNNETKGQVMKIKLLYKGGLNLLFGGDSEQNIELVQDGIKWTFRRLLIHIRDNLVVERPHLFMDGDIVRPGILVLFNGSDWNIYEDKMECEIEDEDTFTFISTLHGG